MQKIVIVGCGFAGMAAARSIGTNYDVTILDRGADFEFLPNIHEIVSNLKTPDMVRLSRAKVAKALGHRFIKETVAEIDPRAREVKTASGARISYDALLLAPGGEPKGLDVPGVREHAQLFETADDARAIRRRLDVMRGMEHTGWVTIIGGGVTGVEVLGEILRRYRKDDNINMRLIDSGERILRGWSNKIARRVKQIAEDRGATILTETRVARVEKAAIILENGQPLPSDLTIWSTGAMAPEFLRRSELALGPNGWTQVDENLQSKTHPNIFVAGDASDLPKPVKKQAAHALRLGERAAKNMKRYLTHKPLKAFQHKKSPYLITFGDLSSFVILVDGTVMESRAFAAGREIVFQATMNELDDTSKSKSVDRLSRRVLTSLERLPWSDPTMLPFHIVDGLLDFRVR